MFYLGDNYKDRFVLPDPNEATAEFSMEDLADDMEGLTPQYPRIKIVSGGANQFDVGQIRKTPTGTIPGRCVPFSAPQQRLLAGGE